MSLKSNLKPVLKSKGIRIVLHAKCDWRGGGGGGGESGKEAMRGQRRPNSYRVKVSSGNSYKPFEAKLTYELLHLHQLQKLIWQSITVKIT